MSDVSLTIIDREGTTHAIVAPSGAALMHVLRERIDLTIGTCGGEISCGTCLVRLDPAWQGRFPAPSQDEADMLEALDAGESSRLSCQLELTEGVSGLTATIASEA